ncbi:MAG: S-methyl-5-thioribose-1-phosphate isomerase [Coriobacteriia bacterium]|nr:S-methyl-5-thioribose-1-phosphate isomerase [Coriobacteriia bacterium]
MTIESIPRTIWWNEGKVYLIDQTRLPLQGDVLVCSTHEGVLLAIRSLAVRGAPALGVAAALALALWSEKEGAEIGSVDEYLARMAEVAAEITAARPTAVNLSWGAERILATAREAARADGGLATEGLRAAVLEESLGMLDEDEERNRSLGAHGAGLLAEKSRVLTHCNAGSLATAYYGTALGVIFSAHEQSKIAHVWVDETRPVNQGGRLTAWELRMAGVPFALIADSMAASIMRNGWVDAVIVGADRIAVNGDTANKIGTYGLAVLAKAHDVPFYVVAPSSTVDFSLPSGEGIVIEERDPRELEGFTVSGTFESGSPEASKAFDMLTSEGAYEVPLAKGHAMTIDRKGGAYAFDAWFRMTPPNINTFNPAFDVTPAELITAIITEKGIVRPDPDYKTALADALGA